MTTITNNRNNGSIEELIDLLKTHPLARRLTWADAPEESAFIDNNWIGVGKSYPTDKGVCFPVSENQDYGGLTQFSGNFFDWSWCFSVRTDDPKLIATLTELIQDNMKRDDYLAQDKPSSIMGKHYILFADGRELHWNNGEYVEMIK